MLYCVFSSVFDTAKCGSFPVTFISCQSHTTPPSSTESFTLRLAPGHPRRPLMLYILISSPLRVQKSSNQQASETGKSTVCSQGRDIKAYWGAHMPTSPRPATSCRIERIELRLHTSGASACHIVIIYLVTTSSHF